MPTPEPETFGDLIGLVVTAVLEQVQIQQGAFPKMSPLRNPLVLQNLAATTLGQHGFTASLMKAKLNHELTKAILLSRQTTVTREMRVK